MSVRHYASFDHHISTQQNRVGNLDAERFRGFHVDDQLELGRLLHRQVGGLCAFEDFINEGCRAPPVIKEVWPIAHEAPSLDKITR